MPPQQYRRLLLDALRIGEVPVQPRPEVRHHRVHRTVQLLGLPVPRGYLAEGLVQLRHVLGPHSDVELAQLNGPETELAARDAEALDLALALEVAEVRADVLGELDVPM